MAQPSPPPDPSGGFLQRLGVILGVVISLVVVAGTIGILYSVFTGSAPRFKNPSALDAVVESRIVLAFLRVGIMAGAVYIVVSVVALISRGQWLSSVGPVKVGESVRAVADDSDALREQLRSAEATITDLRTRLERATRAVEVSNRDRDEVITELSRLKRSISP